MGAKTVSVKIVAGKPVATKTPVKAAAAEKAVPAPLKQASDTALALIPQLKGEVGELEVTDADSYAAADEMFGRIKSVRKDWQASIESVLAPLRQATQALHKLNRDTDRPWAELEDTVERKMRAFKLQEMQALQEARRKNEEETERLRLQLERAKTPAFRAKLEVQIEEKQAETVEVTAGSHTTTKTKRKVRVVNVRAFCKGVATGLIPDDLIEVVQAGLNAYHKTDPESVEGWPGVEGYDDVEIASR